MALSFGVIDTTSAKKTSDLHQALNQLKASDIEWLRERNLYRAQRNAGTINKKEALEYAEFVASLHRQKLENCEKVRRIGGNKALSGTDCLIEQTVGRRASQLPKQVQTIREKSRSLEDELKALEAVVDKKLSRSRQRALERASQRQISMPTRSGSRAQKPKSSSNDDGGNSDKRSAKQANLPSEKAAKQSELNKNQKKGRGKTSEDVDRSPIPLGENTREPDGEIDRGENTAETKRNNSVGERGNDDDVVARQIREAAEDEKDPVLKEKLWEEYRKIKATRD